MKNNIKNKSDSELVRCCNSGESSGYSELYCRYSRAVFNSVYRLVGDRGNAEDITQETFIKAFSEIGSLKNSDSFGGWIKRIGINHSLNHIRKRKVYFTEIEDEIISNIEDDELEAELLLEERISQLQLIIATLPLQTRTIVNLYLFENMSQEDIAKTMDIPHATVKSYYHRAKKKIIEKLKPQNNNERSA